MKCHEVDYKIIADRILQHAPSAGGSRKGEGSLLGALGGFIDGDKR